MSEETMYQKTYRAIEHLNASVNILRSIGNKDAADKVKSLIRGLNEEVYSKRSEPVGTSAV